MYTYFKITVKGGLAEFPSELSPELYNIGSTYTDYLSGKWVPMTDEQKAFKEENPNAAIDEIFNLKLRELPERTIEHAKGEKKSQIYGYDSSDDVNSFYIHDMMIWLDKATRAGLKLRFEAELALGMTETILWYGNIQFPLSLADAVQMLYAIEVYASNCYDNTQRHLAEVDLLDTIEAVDSYDYTTGYPEKLRF